MKRKTLFSILIVVAIIIVAVIVVRVDKKSKDLANEHLTHNQAMEGGVATESDAIMMAMHKPMTEKSFVSGMSYDVSFLENMIPHHQGAVDSAKLVLQYSKDAKIQEIANNIIKAQEKEIAEFTGLINTLKTENKQYDAKMIAEYDAKAQKDTDVMMANMMNVEVSGNVDRDFIVSMIEHHKGAVDSSKTVLSYTSDERIKEIASRIIADQEKEIKEFEALVK